MKPLPVKNLTKQGSWHLYDFGIGSEVFSGAVSAIYTDGVCDAKLIVGDQVLGRTPRTSIPEKGDVQKINFTANDIVLPLHMLRYHTVEIIVYNEVSVRHFWWEAAQDGVVPSNQVLVVTRGRYDEDSCNYWTFTAGMVGPVTARECESLVDLESHLNRDETRRVFEKCSNQSDLDPAECDAVTGQAGRHCSHAANTQC